MKKPIIGIVCAALFCSLGSGNSSDTPSAVTITKGMGDYAEIFQEFLTKLKAYEGETLKEKRENYMLSIGVTQAEIDSIRAIMLGE